jgi:hypothetical protein
MQCRPESVFEASALSDAGGVPLSDPEAVALSDAPGDVVASSVGLPVSEVLGA